MLVIPAPGQWKLRTTSAAPAMRAAAPARPRPGLATGTRGASRARPLAGTVVGIDPGHNGRSWSDPSFINHLIWNGREWESCDTTGTATDGGYTEAQFNWNVAFQTAADLRALGARVVLTRHGNDGIGPCVTQRIATFNRAHVNVALSIHADGGPPGGRGFTVLEPVADGINSRVIRPSRRFAAILRNVYGRLSGMPVSTYDGVDGLQPRDNLAGENLTRVPYALIECGNMRNATDAALLTSATFQRRAAAAISAAIERFLRPRTQREARRSPRRIGPDARRVAPA